MSVKGRLVPADESLHRALGRMEGKLDAVLTEFRGTLAAHGTQLKVHDERITTLEELETERRGVLKAARWLWGALVALVGFVSGFFGSVVR